MNSEEGLYDLIFPVPSTGRTPAQQWFAAQPPRDIYYLPDKWGITGQVWIFPKDGDVIHTKRGEIRFGNHPYMSSFNLCLAVYWDDDDKFELSHCRACFRGGTLMGEIRGCSVVFKPYPFQVNRLRLLLERHPSIDNLAALIGMQMRRCREETMRIE